MAYKLSMRKYWLTWLKQDIQTWFYKTFYGIKTQSRYFSDSILPDTGKGKYVSVYTKGQYIDMVFEVDTFFNGRDVKKGDLIRIIPYQPNHGFMYELWLGGKLIGRNIMTIEQLASNFYWNQEKSRNKNI